VEFRVFGKKIGRKIFKKKIKVFLGSKKEKVKVFRCSKKKVKVGENIRILVFPLVEHRV
jgi:hypothetical protein